MSIIEPFKLASQNFHPANSLITLNSLQVGGRKVAIIAGPHLVENRRSILELAHAVKEAGATALRGGVFKTDITTRFSRYR